MDHWKEIAVTSDENSTFCACHIWDFKTGNEIVRIRQGATNAQCLAFFNDYHLICGSKDPKVFNVWALHKQAKVHTQIKCIAPINALAVSANGTYCIGAIGTKLYVWQVSTGQLIAILTDHYDTVNCIKCDEMESYFVSVAEDGLMAAWSLRNVINSSVSKKAETALTKPLHVWKDHTLGIRDACVTNYGIFPRAISVSRDKSCKIYDLHSGICVFSIYTDDELYSCTLDPLGRFIYLGTLSGVIIKAPTNFCAKEKSLNIKHDYPHLFHGHEKTVKCLSVSADGQYLISGSNDCKAIVWNLNLGNPIQTLKHEGPITNAFFRPYLHLLNEVEVQQSKFLIKPFQFVVSNFDNEVAEVILSSSRQPKNDLNDSMLDNFFGEEEILPQTRQALELQYLKFNDQNTKLYRHSQIMNLMK